MNSLLWKDYRLFRGYLAVALGVLVAPYAAWLYFRLTNSPWQPEMGNNPLYVGGIVALLGTMLIVALLAGSAFATERVERSAEFLAYLPAGRAALLGSKLLLILLVAAVLWLFNPLLVLTAGVWTPPPDWPSNVPVLLPRLGAVTLAIFGVSWLASTRVTSAAALLLGLLTPFFIACVLYAFIDPTRNEALFTTFFFRTNLAVGPVCFALGTVLYLRRENL